MYRVTYVNNEGKPFSVVFQLYWDATKYEMTLVKSGATQIVISEDSDDDGS